MRILSIVAAFAVLALVGAGCCSSGKCTKKQINDLRAPKDVTISGKTGEIVGSYEDQHPKKPICTYCKYPQGSLRQKWILAADEGKLNIDDETKKKLKSHEDITISGATGAIKGTENDKKPNSVKCKDCGFPQGSLRQRVILYEEH